MGPPLCCRRLEYGCLAGGCTPDTHEYKKGPFQQTWHRNDQFIEEQGHITDLITKEAVSWIGQRGDKPFFLYVPFTAVHVPIAEPEKYLAMNSHIADAGKRLYAADVSHLDDCVGQIIAALEKKGVRDNTFVLFLSDNGAHQPISDKEPNYPGADSRPDVKVGGVNTPLRGFKTQVYEGGIRTPAIAHWPAKWKPATINAPRVIRSPANRERCGALTRATLASARPRARGSRRRQPELAPHHAHRAGLDDGPPARSLTFRTSRAARAGPAAGRRWRT